MKYSKEILRKLGGDEFVSMTGVKNLIGSSAERSLTFDLPGQGILRGINKAKVFATPADDYTIEFYMIRGVEITIIDEVTAVQGDDLRDVFTRVTGLETPRRMKLEVQDQRHAVLKKIIDLIENLRKNDDEGADWVLEQLTKP